MSDNSITVCVKKQMRNPLLSRKQLVVEVSHPGKPAQKKEDVTKLVAKLLSADESTIVLYGFKTAFGGGRSTGFGLVYEDKDALKQFEPKHRQIRLGLATKKTRTRKQWKDSKRKSKRTWGTGRRAAARAAKKAAAS